MYSCSGSSSDGVWEAGRRGLPRIHVESGCRWLMWAASSSRWLLEDRGSICGRPCFFFFIIFLRCKGINLLVDCRLLCVRTAMPYKKQIKILTSPVKTMYSCSGSSSDGVWEAGRRGLPRIHVESGCRWLMWAASYSRWLLEDRGSICGRPCWPLAVEDALILLCGCHQIEQIQSWCLLAHVLLMYVLLLKWPAFRRERNTFKLNLSALKVCLTEPHVSGTVVSSISLL